MVLDICDKFGKVSCPPPSSPFRLRRGTRVFRERWPGRTLPMSDASKPGRRLAGPKACPDASVGVPASTTDWSQRRHRRRDCTPTSPTVTSARWSQTKEPYLSSVKEVADPQPPLPNFGFNPEGRF